MKSLYVKFIFITISIMIFSSICSFALSNIYYHQKLKPENDAKITKIAMNMAQFTEKHPTMNLDDYLHNLSSIGYQLLIVDEAGNERFFGAPFREKKLSDDVKQQVLAGETFHGIRNFPNKTFVTGFFANELDNSIGIPLTHKGQNYALFIRPNIKLMFNEMHFLFAWLLVLMILLSIVMVIISTNYLVKPISKLTAATKRLARGNFDVELETKRKDEIGELSDSFLRMAHQLERVEETRKEFISNISHDIQSPLSNIKGYTNLLENTSLPLEERKNYIEIINSEINRLTSLTKQLLLLARLDRDETFMEVKPVHVGEQLKQLIRSYQWQIAEKGLTLELALSDVTVEGDPSLLNTVWDNLLSNAIKYNKENGHIEIIVEHEEPMLAITFKDTGIGLNTHEIDKIFNNFYRVDSARTSTVAGTGLGLSIVDSIVQLHDGHISIQSKENEGTSFTIELPISNNHIRKN